MGYGLTRIQCSVLCCCVCCFIFNAAAGRFLQMLMPIADHIWLHQFSCHLSQCFTPKHHSLLQSRLPNPWAHMWAELLHHPCVLGFPTKGQNQKWLPNPCHLGGPRVGGMA